MFGFGQVLEVLQAEVGEGQHVADGVGHAGRHEGLTAMGGRHDAGRSVHRRAEPHVVAFLGDTGVEPEPDPDRRVTGPLHGGELGLDHRRGRARVVERLEHRTERITRCGEHPSRRGERGAHDLVVALERPAHVVGMGLPQARRSLDVGEEEADRPGTRVDRHDRHCTFLLAGRPHPLRVCGRATAMVEKLSKAFRRAQLSLSVGYVTVLITLNSLVKKERMSHENGIATRGTLRIVDHPTFPDHDFFTPGRTFDIRLRHATVLYRDDAKLTVRGAAIKFADTRFESPYDLLMNSGRVGLFFDARTFMQFMRGTMAGRGKKWLPYLTSRPQAMFGGGDSVRRNPSSFAEVSYNTKTCYGFIARDTTRYYARYRLIPEHWDGEDSGMPSPFEREHSWLQNPLPDETRTRNYLKDELRHRLAQGEVHYRLQIQVRVRPDGPEPMWTTSEYRWNEDEVPWHELATVTLTEALPHEEAQRTWFSLANHPESLPVPLGTSIDDPHSLNNLRLASDAARKARLWSYKLRGMPGPFGDSRHDPDWVGVPPMANPPGD